MNNLQRISECFKFVKEFGIKKVHEAIIHAKIRGEFVPNYQAKLDKLFWLLDDETKLEEAKIYLIELRKEFGNAPILGKAQAIIESIENE